MKLTYLANAADSEADTRKSSLLAARGSIRPQVIMLSDVTVAGITCTKMAGFCDQSAQNSI
jgi:hypothetical protein